MAERVTLTFDPDKELKRLADTIKRLGDVPQKCVTSAARRAGTMMRNAAREEAPEKTGTLRGGIITFGERSRLRGKKVYEVVMDRALNEVFQKPIQNPGQFGGENKKGYYPASMEYGFLTRSRGGGLSYVPGHFFLHESAAKTEGRAKVLLVQTLEKNLEKELAKKNGT